MKFREIKETNLLRKAKLVRLKIDKAGLFLQYLKVVGAILGKLTIIHQEKEM